MKARTNVTVDRDLLERARDEGWSVSDVLSDALATRIRALETQRWQEDNRVALAAYTEDIEEHGIWSDSLRTF